MDQERKNLANAIQQMHQFLDQSSDEDMQNVDQGDEEGGGLDKYLEILNGKFNKIQKILEEEESAYKKTNQENQELKEAFAQALQESHQYIEEKQQEKQNLLEQYDGIQKQQAQQQLEKKFKKLELIQLEEQINQKEAEIEEKIKNQNEIQQLINEIKNPLQILEKEIALIQEKLSISKQELEQVNLIYEKQLGEFGANKQYLASLINKNNLVQNQLNKVYSFKLNYEEENKKIQSEISNIIRKSNKSHLRYQELCNLREKIAIENQIKNQDLNELRKQNLLLEEKFRQLSRMDFNAQSSKDQFHRLIVERDILQKDHEMILQQLSQLTGQRDDQQAISKQDVAQIEKILNLDQLQQGGDLQKYEEDLKIKNEYINIQILELDHNINSRNKIIESQQQGIQNLKSTIIQLQAQVQVTEGEKKELIDNYEKLELQMDELNINFKNLSKSINSTNQNNQLEIQAKTPTKYVQSFQNKIESNQKKYESNKSGPIDNIKDIDIDEILNKKPEVLDVHKFLIKNI